jgi:hypothetical protein
MQDLLQRIDLDYYRAAQLLIVRAEIAQLRRQSSALARTGQHRKIPRESRAVDDFDQGAHAAPVVQSDSPEMKSWRREISITESAFGSED